MKERDKKINDRLFNIYILACCFLYVLMMGSKNAYTAEIVAIQGVFTATKAQVSLAMTYYFIVYAIGHVLLIFFIPKINMTIYLAITSVLSAVLTVLIGFAPSLQFIYAVCAVNGALQAGVYSGCMGLLAKHLPTRLLPRANTIMSIGSATASVISYSVPALCLSIGRWNLPFILLGVLFLISVVFFVFVSRLVKKSNKSIQQDSLQENENKGSQTNLDSNKKTIINFFAFAILLTVISNVLYYAIMNYIPNLLKDVHGMPDNVSVLITLVVPLFSVIGSFISINICEKIKNYYSVALVFFVLSALIIGLVSLIYSSNVVITIIFLIFYIILSVAGRAVFSGIMAFKMKKIINPGVYSAGTNAFAAVVAGVIPPLAGNLIDAAGWNTLFISLTIGCLLLSAILLISSIHFNKK